MELYIGKPFIKRLADTSRLCSMISDGDTSYEMYYEVEQKWESFLCSERADAFVVAVLPYVMLQGGVIKSEQTISEELYYNLTTELIPAMSKYTQEYQSVSIIAPLSSERLPCKGAVGTGISGGVDSFYTIFRHLNDEIPDYRLSMLTFFNVGSHGDFGGEQARQLFQERMTEARQNAENLKLDFVWIDSNLSEYIKMTYSATSSFRLLSAILAVQKLFSVYYLSSGRALKHFHVDEEHCAAFDLLITKCLSTKTTGLFVDGMIDDRIDKVEYIHQIPYVQKHLNVCVNDSENCSHCEKCLRTMTALYAINKLELFSEVFDVDDYKKHLAKRLAFMLGRVRKDDYRQSYRMLKKNKIKIPFSSYILCIPKWCKEGIRPLYNRLGVMKKIWRKIRSK